MNEKIDFVITWVDCNDPKWQKEKNKYKPEKNTDTSVNRYRDWENLKYWFRGVEKYAPWVNKIYFITYGHTPNWLNTDNEKLVIVKHEDYIPKEYLPVFNSVPIELYMSKIKGLSENFVYFNDDMFLINKTSKEDFFKNGLPCDNAILTAIVPSKINDGFSHCLLSNIEIINERYDMKNIIKKNPFKWFNIKYGIDQIRTLLLLLWNNFPGIKMSHLPVSYKKSTFKEVWKYAEDKIEEASKDRFRNNYHINHWIFRNHQLVEGAFSPRKKSFGKFYVVTDDNKEIIDTIKKQKKKCICINDVGNFKNFEKTKKEINTAFESILNEKSSFEK